MFLTFAHQIWKNHLKEGARAIDATCGNGYDTEVLAKLNLSRLYVFDIQKEALENTRNRVGTNQIISYHLACHSRFESVDAAVDLIVYNLGYLPGGDKSLTTKLETTLQSFKRGIELLNPEGLISCMCYPGHSEGDREESALLHFSKSLNPKKFQVSHHRALNRSKAPSLLLIHKTI